MKYLHVILPSTRMMETYMKMLGKYYLKEQNTFYLLGSCPHSQIEIFKFGKVIVLKNSKNKLEKIKNFYNDLSNYDCIIWHGLVLSPKFALFLFIFRKFLKKSVWVMWGIDLYAWKRKPDSIKNKIINYFNYYIRKNMEKVVAIFPTDIEAYKRIFKNDKSDIFYAPYPIRESVFAELEAINPVEKRANGEVWIQIGNNANSFNRHLEIIEELSKYKNEKVRLFIPMSYGNDWHNKENNYIDIVREKAIQIFGEKRVVVLKNLMSIEEYSKFLEQIDVMVIATDRQNALGNILKNMYSGGKIFLSEKNSLYSYFNSIGIEICKYEDIKNMSFKEFASHTDNRQLKKWMIENTFPEYNLLFWDKIFENIDSNSSLKNNYKKDITYFLNNIDVHIKGMGTLHEKKNYINLDKYMYKNQAILKKLNAAEDVVVIGSDDSVVKVIQNIVHENKIKYRWNVMGIVSDELRDFGYSMYGFNSISSLKNFKEYISYKCINFCDDQYKREQYTEKILLNGGNVVSIVLFNARIGHHFNYEYAFYLGQNSIIGHRCTLGKMVKIGHNVVIGCNCQIGNYVNIGDNVTIPDGTVISDYTIVGNIY